VLKIAKTAAKEAEVLNNRASWAKMAAARGTCTNLVNLATL